MFYLLKNIIKYYKMNFVKLYDVKNSYDHPNCSLSFILNSYKSKINYPMVFHQ